MTSETSICMNKYCWYWVVARSWHGTVGQGNRILEKNHLTSYLLSAKNCICFVACMYFQIYSIHNMKQAFHSIRKRYSELTFLSHSAQVFSMTMPRLWLSLVLLMFRAIIWGYELHPDDFSTGQQTDGWQTPSKKRSDLSILVGETAMSSAGVRLAAAARQF